jgi:hypothetical protein
MTVVLSRNCATELLEVIKHLDKEILKRIPEKVIKMIKERSDSSYRFQYDSRIPYAEQKISTETRLALARIYLTYCCSPEEADDLIQINNHMYKKRRAETTEIVHTIKSADIVAPIHSEVVVIPKPKETRAIINDKTYEVNSMVDVTIENNDNIVVPQNKDINNAQVVSNNQQMVEKKENLFTKLIDKIKGIFKK